jgi:hypothetical protein
MDKGLLWREHNALTGFIVMDKCSGRQEERFPLGGDPAGGWAGEKTKTHLVLHTKQLFF